MSDYVTKNGETISRDQRSTIAMRYHTITKAINQEFWNSISEDNHSYYVGSYGRGTAIDTSDIDVLVIMPEAEYNRYDRMKGNGQSRLLQAVKEAIKTKYPSTEVKADGQVVVMNFSDGMRFEVLPAFANSSASGSTTISFRYPDTNMGGRWKSTYPLLEQLYMDAKNDKSNGLLFDTCKHMRRIRDSHFRSYHLSGIVIDSFVYAAIDDWHWVVEGETSTKAQGTYENILLSYLRRIHPYDYMNFTLQAPGSKQLVDATGSYVCLKKVLEHMVG